MIEVWIKHTIMVLLRSPPSAGFNRTKFLRRILPWPHAPCDSAERLTDNSNYNARGVDRVSENNDTLVPFVGTEDSDMYFPPSVMGPLDQTSAFSSLDVEYRVMIYDFLGLTAGLTFLVLNHSLAVDWGYYISLQVKNYSPKHMKQNAAEKNTGEACPRGGRVVLCVCMRCSSSWKAAWAECTCVGAARYMYVRGALRDICKRTVF